MLNASAWNFSGEALRNFEGLENREIEPRLEWSAEDIAAVRPVAGFQGVANGRSIGRKTARRNSALARVEGTGWRSRSD